jgi:hypothetical protein
LAKAAGAGQVYGASVGEIFKPSHGERSLPACAVTASQTSIPATRGQHFETLRIVPIILTPFGCVQRVDLEGLRISD